MFFFVFLWYDLSFFLQVDNMKRARSDFVLDLTMDDCYCVERVENGWIHRDVYNVKTSKSWVEVVDLSGQCPRENVKKVKAAPSLVYFDGEILNMQPNVTGDCFCDTTTHMKFIETCI